LDESPAKMSAPDSTRKVDFTRTMPGSFDKKEDKKEETEHTPYMAKSVQANEAPTWDNFRAGFFSWLTLAGYVVFPGAFTSLKTSKTLASSTAGRVVQDTAKHVPLLILAAACCGVGTFGTGWLWWIWRGNAVWLLDHIFL
jgi:hypothetical protein